MKIYHLWATLFVNTAFPLFLLIMNTLNLGIFGFTFIHVFIGFLVLLTGCIEILIWNQSIKGNSVHIKSSGVLHDIHIYDKIKWFKFIFPFIKYGMGWDLYYNKVRDHYFLLRKFHPNSIQYKEIFPKIFIEDIRGE